MHVDKKGPSDKLTLLGEPFHLVRGTNPRTRFTFTECQLACVLALSVRLQDDTPLENNAIGQIVGAGSGSGWHFLNYTGLGRPACEARTIAPTKLRFG